MKWLGSMHLKRCATLDNRSRITFSSIYYYLHSLYSNHIAVEPHSEVNVDLVLEVLSQTYY